LINLEDNDPLTHRIIGCAIEVHRTLGPGLLDSAYERCIATALDGKTRAPRCAAASKSI
jgi:GxxExxY protein